MRRFADVDWFAEVKACGVLTVAQAFGLERGPSRSFGPCPACHQPTRHRKSEPKRNPRFALEMLHEGHGWKCMQCEEKGDAIDLAALVVLAGKEPRREDWPTVRTACAAAGLCSPDPREPRRPAQRVTIARPSVPKPPEQPTPQRPPQAEVLELWNAGLRPELACVSDDEGAQAAALYMAHRGINLGDLALFEPDLCRILPAPSWGRFPAWWPTWRSNPYPWRWAVLAYDWQGHVANIHARDTTIPRARELELEERPWRKDTWPKGPGGATGLLFANRRGVALLRGDSGDTEAVLFTEGLTDTVRVAALFPARGRRYAVLGITSGAVTGLARIAWPALPLLIGTDADKKGDEYAAEIRRVLPREATVRRVDFREKRNNQ